MKLLWIEIQLPSADAPAIQGRFFRLAFPCGWCAVARVGPTDRRCRFARGSLAIPPHTFCRRFRNGVLPRLFRGRCWASAAGRVAHRNRVPGKSCRPKRCVISRQYWSGFWNAELSRVDDPSLKNKRRKILHWLNINRTDSIRLIHSAHLAPVCLLIYWLASVILLWF